MTTDEFVAFVDKQRVFYEKASELPKELEAMRWTNTILTQYIAGLVLEHGGDISAENWERVNANDKFIPWSLSVTDTGVLIKVKLDHGEQPA